MAKTLINRAFWNNIKRVAANPRQNVIFEELFFRYLKNVNNEKLAIEIGCVPGLYLAHVCKFFGFFPEGIDFAEQAEKITGQTLRNFGLFEYKIYTEDFLNWKPAKKYDLVLSFGFIEHFLNAYEIIKLHIDLLAKGGTIILEVPNFAYGQKILHNSVDRDDLLRHNLKIMKKSYFETIANNFDLRIRFLGYYGGLFGFWWINESPSKTQRIAYCIYRAVGEFARKIPLNNKYFSPFLVMVAVKS